jgi:hypothetical protein
MPLKLTFAAQSALGLMLLSVGCAPSLEEQTNEHNTMLAAPSQDTFPEVGDALQISCATLDCHGQVGRNLRIYGYGGLRLSSVDTPLGDPTTELEYLASYESLVSLEPETLSKVVRLQADPNELSLVRKTRGIEHHKGGQRAQEGDPLDLCIVLWLTGKFDPNPCTDVVNAPHPPPNEATTP